MKEGRNSLSPSDNSPPDGQTQRAIRATIWAALDVLIPLLTGLGVFVFTSRLLSPADFGTVALATGMAYLGAALCPGGFGEAIVQRPAIEPRHLDTIFWLCMACGVMVYALEFALAPQVAHWFKLPILAVFIRVLAVRILADMLAVVPNALIARAMSFHLFVVKSLFVTGLAAAVITFMLLRGEGIWALVASQLTASLVNAVAAFVTSKWRPGLRTSPRALRELAGYGLFSTGTQNISKIFLQNEQILVGVFLGTTQLGLYNFSKRVLDTFNSVVAGALNAVAHPMFSGIQTEHDRVRRGFLMATFVSSTVSFPIFAGLAMVADRVVPVVFGPHWTGAVILVRMQCALGLISCIGMLQAGLINSKGKADWWFYWQLFAMVTTAAVIVALARYGLAIMLGVMVLRAYLLWFIPVTLCLHLLELKPLAYLKNFRAPLAATALMGLAITAERRLLPGLPAMPGLASDIATGSATYGAAIIAMEYPRLKTLITLVSPYRRRPRSVAG